MRAKRFQPVFIAVCLPPLLVSLSGSVSAQCTDTDVDGFFYEAGCGTASDCNDADANTYPGAAEPCDGYDNDCDGQLDNDPGCDATCDLPGKLGLDVRITDNEFWSQNPEVVWTGSGYGLVWQDDGIFFARLDETGNKIGDDIPVTGRGGESVSRVDRFGIRRGVDGQSGLPG
jgi:hypothetical protein